VLRAASKRLTTQIIVIDNASVDGSYQFLKSNYPDILLIGNSDNVGFGRANNQALPYVQGKYVLLLNTDALVSPDTLDKTLAYMDSNPKCGVLGVKLVGRLHELQPSCRYFPTPWNIFLNSTGLGRFFSNVQMVDNMNWDHASVRLCDWVTGCFYLVRREVIDQVGLFDPRYFLYYEEVDHCLSVKKVGWEIHYYPYTTVIHIGGESAKTEGELTANGSQLEEIAVESELLYFRKNHGLVAVFTRVFLALLGDAICAFKILIRRKRPQEALVYLKHSVLTFNLLVRTRFGSKPTR
jgi:GT2 family glycosyltransferase